MFKLFVNFLCAVALADVVLAQGIFIASPKPNSNVVAGSEVVVQVGKVVSHTSSIDVAVMLGAARCTPECPDVSKDLGDTLYIGPYDAELHLDASEPYENITVTIPSRYRGPIQLGAAHGYLHGVDDSPELQLTSISLNVVAF